MRRRRAVLAESLPLFGLALVILGIVIYSYKFQISPIRWTLYLQAVVFLLSNLNIYRKENYKNYLGLNMLSTVFSIIFTVMNTLLASMVS